MPPAECPHTARVATLLADPAGRLDIELARHLTGCEECRRAAASARPARPAPRPARSHFQWWGHTSDPATDDSASDSYSSARPASPVEARPVARAAIPLELGPYFLLDRIDAGGMGEVFRAWHRFLQREDAVKMMRPELTADADAVRRFLREAEAAARLNHPNVVRVFAADHAEVGYYLAMELVPGTNLDKLVRATGPLPVAVACEYVRQAAEGLDHASRAGLVHRDVKPGNLLVTQDRSTVKVADFGLARALAPGLPEAHDGAGTRPGDFLGTTDYMAPEQAADPRAADTRSDIYALGCTLYYLLTGRVPFPGGTLRDKLNRHATELLSPVRAVRADVPAGLDAFISRCTAKQPGDRYQTFAELAAALVSAAPDAPPPRRSRRAWVAGGVLALLVGVVSLALVLTTGRDPEPLPPAPGPVEVVKTPEPPVVKVPEPEPACWVPPPKTDAGSPWVFSGTCWSERRDSIDAIGFMPDGSIHAGRGGGHDGSDTGFWERWPPGAGGRPTHSGRPVGARSYDFPLLISPGGYYHTKLFQRYEPVTLQRQKPLSSDMKDVDTGSCDNLGSLFEIGDGKSLIGDAAPWDIAKRNLRLVVRWDAKTGAVDAGWKVESAYQLADVSADRTGTVVATGTREGRLRVLRAKPEAGREWAAPNGPDGRPDPVYAVALSLDGKTMYSAHKDTRAVLVWDSANGAPLRELPIDWAANRLVVSPDGRWLAAVGYGATVWDLRAGPPRAYTLASWPSGGEWNRVVFNPESTRLAVGGKPGVVWLWNLK
jgi:hypothetical protein